MTSGATDLTLLKKRRHQMNDPTNARDASGCPFHSSNGMSVPDFLRIMVSDDERASAQSRRRAVGAALNSSMMAIYDEALAKYMRNMRRRVPIILALFTGEGGQMILLPPRPRPEVAPPVPIAYQLAKSVGHSTMAIYQIVAPYLANPSGPVLARPDASVPGAECIGSREPRRPGYVRRRPRRPPRYPQRNLAFMDDCLADRGYTYAELEILRPRMTPYAVKTIGIAAEPRWATGWRSSRSGKSCSATTGTHLRRQQLAVRDPAEQHPVHGPGAVHGQEAIGDRLLLFETPEFTTTPETLLDVLCRIVADRGMGQVFFKDYYLMDAELLGGGAEEGDRTGRTRRGMTPLLPTRPRSTRTTGPLADRPDQGTGPSSLDEPHPLPSKAG